jgi:hypothetical protein
MPTQRDIHEPRNPHLGGPSAPPVRYPGGRRLTIDPIHLSNNHPNARPQSVVYLTSSNFRLSNDKGGKASKRMVEPIIGRVQVPRIHNYRFISTTILLSCYQLQDHQDNWVDVHKPPFRSRFQVK